MAQDLFEEKKQQNLLKKEALVRDHFNNAGYKNAFGHKLTLGPLTTEQIEHLWKKLKKLRDEEAFEKQKHQ